MVFIISFVEKKEENDDTTVTLPLPVSWLCLVRSMHNTGRMYGLSTTVKCAASTKFLSVSSH